MGMASSVLEISLLYVFIRISHKPWFTGSKIESAQKIHASRGGREMHANHFGGHDISGWTIKEIK